MKPKYVIVSCNEEPLYKDFWPLVRDLWQDIIGIVPILVEIGDEDKVVEDASSIIHKIRKVPHIDSGLQAQIARMYITKFYPDEVCLTSDIDMLPLSKDYFITQVDPFPDNSLVIFSSDAYPVKRSRYPICYTAAQGNTFNAVMGLDKSFTEYAQHLAARDEGWDTDELYFGEKVDSFRDNSRIVKLERGGWNSGGRRRIDRLRWKDIPVAEEYNVEFFSKAEYIDCHAPRPYKKWNKKRVDALVRALYKSLDYVNQF